MMPKILVTDPKRYGDEFPPSRPTLMMLTVAVIIVIGGVALVNWPEISSFMHFAEMKAALGL